MADSIPGLATWSAAQIALLDELIVLCGAQHRAQHRGQLVIEGRISTGVTFRHADGSSYGAVADPYVAEGHAKAFRALRGLGFREGDARAALAHVRAKPHVGDAAIPSVIREALSFLTS